MRKLIDYFMNKCVSVSHMGISWFSRIMAALIEAARMHSYVETVSPSQSDTLHKEIKCSDEELLKHEMERCVRIALKFLRFGRVKVAIDVTEEPYWGKKGVVNTRASVHERSEESWQFATLSVVEPYFFPLMSLPYRQIDDLDTLVIDMLEYLRTLPFKIDLILFDRGFYHAHLIDYLENKKGGRPLPYLILVPKNDAMKGYIEQTEGILGTFRHEMNYSYKKSKWKPKTTIVVCKGVIKNKKGEPIDFCLATNKRPCLELVKSYRKRWNIETGFRIHDEATIKTKTSHPLIRYFYHMVGMVIIIMWRMRNYLDKTMPYIVFKRYLKELEVFYSTACVSKPPD
jgi:Transposase DDE domain